MCRPSSLYFDRVVIAIANRFFRAANFVSISCHLICTFCALLNCFDLLLIRLLALKFVCFAWLIE